MFTDQQLADIKAKVTKLDQDQQADDAAQAALATAQATADSATAALVGAQ